MNRSSPAASDCPDAASAQHRDAASARHPYSVSAMASASSVASEASSDATTTPQPSARSYACRIDPDAVADDLTPLVEKASGLVAAAAPTPDAILGSFIGIAALIRSVSFQEGRLLEEAMIAIGQRNPDLVVLSSGVRLPVTPAALEAVERYLEPRPGGLHTHMSDDVRTAGLGIDRPFLLADPVRFRTSCGFACPISAPALRTSRRA